MEKPKYALIAGALVFSIICVWVLPSIAQSYNQRVQQTQQILQSRGYSPGPADGIFGNQTRRAIKQFQSDNGLAPTGRIDNKTAESLGLAGPSPAPVNQACVPRPTYVLGRNCYKACLSGGTSPQECNTLQVQCQACWNAFGVCKQGIGQSDGYSCTSCSAAYASCIGPFLAKRR